MGEIMFVKLVPVNKKRGYTRRGHVQKWKGEFIRFDQPGIWIKVPFELGKILENVRQRPNDPASPPVFIVRDEYGARHLDKVEEERRLAEKARVEPSVDTALDFTTKEGRGDLSLSEIAANRTESRKRALRELDYMASSNRVPKPEEIEIEAEESDIELDIETSEEAQSESETKAKSKSKSKKK